MKKRALQLILPLATLLPLSAGEIFSEKHGSFTMETTTEWIATNTKSSMSGKIAFDQFGKLAYTKTAGKQAIPGTSITINMDMITIQKNDTLYMLNNSDKTYTAEFIGDDSDDKEDDLSKDEGKKVGTAKFLEKTCDLYVDAKDDQRDSVWIWRGMELKRVSEAMSGTAVVAKTTMVSRDINLSKPSASLFVIPKEYTRDSEREEVINTFKDDENGDASVSNGEVASNESKSEEKSSDTKSKDDNDEYQPSEEDMMKALKMMQKDAKALEGSLFGF